jgi:uncharacterized protein YodC (DUF2158 family)
MEFNRPTFVNRLSIATTLALGIALSTPLSVPALSDPAPSAMRSQTATPFQLGERVRMRSGGPMMIVDGIRGNQVDCYWTGMDGVPISESFPAAVLQKF